MKKFTFILFFMLHFSTYACKVVLINYLKESKISENSKNLELYSDSKENYAENLIFKFNDKLYVYGKEFLTVNDKTYKYLGHGYYQNKNKIYFFDQEVTEIKHKSNIKTYVEIKRDKTLDRTSCDGVFNDYFYYLEINDVQYLNGKRENINTEQEHTNFFVRFLKKIFHF